MAKKCEVRGAPHFAPPVVAGLLSTGITGGFISTRGIYSSDIGNIMVRHTTDPGGKYGMMCPTTDVAGKVFGYLVGFDPDSSNLNGLQYIGPGSTQKIYMRKFSEYNEYAIKYSTLNSTVLPATTDIGSLIGFATTHFSGSSDISITPEYAKLCMSNVGSSVLPGTSGSTNGAKLFRITGFENTSRTIFCVPIPESSGFTW